MFSFSRFVQIVSGLAKWYRSQPPAAPIQQPPVRGLVSFGGPVDPAYEPSAENLEAIERSIRSQKPIDDRIKAEAAAVTLAQMQITECLELLRSLPRKSQTPGPQQETHNESTIEA